jgi:CheY-like chemotaxis protein
MGDSDGFSRSGRRSERVPTAQNAGVVVGRVALKRESVSKKAKSIPPPARRRALDPPNLHGLRVLAVEDDRDLQILFKLQLEMCGAFVGVAGSCREARASLTGGDWDLMIADLGLPDGSGHDLARFAGALARPTPCIALSGRGDKEEVDEARRAGFRMHLQKPCDPITLARVAEQFRRSPTR